MTCSDVAGDTPSSTAWSPTSQPLQPSRQLAADRAARCLDEAARGRGQALVLAGEPGIGRTAVVDWVVSTAGDEFLVARVSGCAPGSEVEGAGLAELARQLVRGSAGDVALVTGSEVERNPVKDLGVDEAVDVVLALLDGAGRSVLMAVDDAHWLDRLSAAVLGRVGRRLGGRAAALVISARSGFRAGSAVPPELRGLPCVVLGRLTDQEAADLFAQLTSEEQRSVSDGLADTIALAAGNPLALAFFGAGGTAAGGYAPPKFRAWLEQQFAPELDVLSPAARQALDEIAVWLGGRSGTGALPDTCPCAARSELEAAGLLRVQAGRWSLTHPLLAPAALAHVDPVEFRALHARAAAALAEDGQPATVVRRLRHRLCAAEGCDDQLAHELENAVRCLCMEVAVAGRLLLNAASISSQGGDRWRRQVEGLDRLLVAGCLAEVNAHLSGARAGSASFMDRAKLTDLRVRAEALSGRLWVARDTLVRLAADTAAEGEPDSACERYVGSALLSVELGEPEATSAALSAARRLGNPARTPLGSAIVALTSSLNGLPPAAPPVEAGDAAAVPAAWGFALMGCTGQALDLLERAVDASRRLGADGLLTGQLIALSGLRLASGRVAAARLGAEEALRLARSTGARMMEPRALLAQARVDAVAGRERECRSQVAEAMAWCRVEQDTSLLVQASAVLGFLGLSLGDPVETLAHLEAIPQIRLVEDAVLPWVGDLVEALVRCGARGRATQVLASVDERGRAPVGVGCALDRGRGLLADDPDEAVAVLVGAVDAARKAGLPMAEARGLTVLGEVLAAQGSVDARPSILAGVALFDRLGAMQWRAQAIRLLRATDSNLLCDLSPAAQPAPSGRSPDTSERVDLSALTAQELSVARMAAQGLTNRQVATALFVSVRTVEFHLSNAYRKLQVNRRAQLVRLMTVPDGALPAQFD